ncbi:MAG: hypothetical protein CMH30_03640 [Micavibrio sp.]|nr:hypothetical protein [Micavibrio sp.]|tara:strand:- start:134 stop:484 length:351 start_codon:yes stop_codon:yes gene_type:complete
MFGKYTDLGSNRGLVEAIGFYLFFTIFLVGLSSTIVYVMGTVGVVGTVSTFFTGGGIHTIIGSAWVLFLSSMVVSSKKLTGDMLAIVLVLLGTYLSYEVNVLLGMIPVTILTMIKK